MTWFQESTSGNNQNLTDYDANNRIQYRGIATKGTPTSATSWVLHKYTYNAKGQVTKDALAYGSWDLKTTSSYS